MDADALGRRFVGRQCPAPGAAPLTWDATFEAVLSFYEEDRADGCDPAAGGDRLVFRWGPWGPGGAMFGVELAREVLGAREPGERWVFVLAFRYLLDDALRSCQCGILTCGMPGQVDEFRRRVAESAAYRAAGRRKPAGTSLCYGPADVCRPPGQPGWHSAPGR
jgi:hypothetical protein